MFKDAQNYLQISYDLSREQFGDNTQEIIPSLRNYSLILLEQRQYEDAIVLLKRYESLMHNICFSPELMSCTLDMVEVYDLLSYAHLLNKEYPTARAYLLKGSDIVIFHSGDPTIEEMAWRTDKLAFLLFCDGKSKEAEEKWLQAKEMIRGFRGGDEFHHDVARITKNIAVCCCSRHPDF